MRSMWPFHPSLTPCEEPSREESGPAWGVLAFYEERLDDFKEEDNRDSRGD